jgi:formate hydrogenlyase subunit 6/NADH:ubiquinone oxidoreductase subunit I
MDGGVRMAHLRSPLLPELLRTLLGRRVTVRYPHGPLELPEGYRGLVVVDPDLCRGCGVCVRDCASEALVLERGEHGAFRLVLYPERCAYCGQCEASCRFGAIRLTNAFKPGEADKSDLVTVLVDRPADEPEENDDEAEG